MGREGESAGQPLFRVEPTEHGRALPEEIPVHGQADHQVVGRAHVVAFLTRIDRDDLARLAAAASPGGACVPRQHGSEPKAATGKADEGLLTQPDIASNTNPSTPAAACGCRAICSSRGSTATTRSVPRWQHATRTAG